jgi:hypothetical protein
MWVAPIPINALGHDRYSAQKVAGAFVKAFEGLRRQVVAVQPAGPQLFQPAVFDRDNRRARPEKPLDISRGCYAIGVIRHAGALTRDQVVAEALRINGPHGGLYSVFGRSRLESFDAGLLADMKQHGRI